METQLLQLTCLKPYLGNSLRLSDNPEGTESHRDVRQNFTYKLGATELYHVSSMHLLSLQRRPRLGKGTDSAGLGVPAVTSPGRLRSANANHVTRAQRLLPTWDLTLQ